MLKAIQWFLRRINYRPILWAIVQTLEMGFREADASLQRVVR